MSIRGPVACGLIWALLGSAIAAEQRRATRAALVKPSVRTETAATMKHATAEASQQLGSERAQGVRAPSFEVDSSDRAVELRWSEPDGTPRYRTEPVRGQLDVIISAGARLSPDNDRVRYAYSLATLATSQRAAAIWGLVTNKSDLRGTGVVPGWGSRHLKPGGFGFDPTLPGWRWVAEEPVLRPGGDVFGGFGVESRGLPGLVRCFAIGHAADAEWASDTGQEDGVPEVIGVVMDRLVPKITFAAGMTIGPVETPSEPQQRLQSLIGAMQQMGQLGWLDSPSSTEEMTGHLREVGALLSSGRTAEGMERAQELAKRAEALASEGRILTEVRDLLVVHLTTLCSELLREKPSSAQRDGKDQ
jgi:hypothetical protein